jgi:hypothetical protein
MAASSSAPLSAVMARFEDEVTKLCGPGLAQYEFDALVSFEFNTGGLPWMHRSTPATATQGSKWSFDRPPDPIWVEQAEPMPPHELCRSAIGSNRG